MGSRGAEPLARRPPVRCTRTVCSEKSGTSRAAGAGAGAAAVGTAPRRSRRCRSAGRPLLRLQIFLMRAPLLYSVLSSVFSKGRRWPPVLAAEIGYWKNAEVGTRAPMQQRPVRMGPSNFFEGIAGVMEFKLVCIRLPVVF